MDAHKVYEDDSLQVVQDSSEYTWVDETNKTTNVQKILCQLKLLTRGIDKMTHYVYDYFTVKHGKQYFGAEMRSLC